MKKKRIYIVLMTIVGLLCIPALAMLFTDSVNWSISDFIVMGLLLLLSGLAIEMVLRWVSSAKYRILLGVIIVLTFLLIWAELAVGILGTPLAGY